MNQGRWVRKAKNGLNVIFIHGINSSEDCWRNKNGFYWPKLLEDESELADTGIYVFSYRTGINTGSYSLSDIVDSLREYFILDDLISSAGVIFVCHSMGGIVTRRFLVNQYSMLIERELNRIGLFLLASPSLGSEYANMLGLVSSALGHTQASALRFSQDNVWLNDLDKDFINLQTNKNLQIKGKELIEDLPLYGKGFIRRQVVEPFSGAKYFGNSFKVPGSDHSTIAVPAGRDGVQHRLLVQFIKECIQEKFDSREFHNALNPNTNSSNTSVSPDISVSVVSTTAIFQKIVKELSDIKYNFDLGRVLESIQNAHYGPNTKEKSQTNAIAFLTFAVSLTNSDGLKNKLNELESCYLQKTELNNELVQEIFSDCCFKNFEFTLYKILKKSLDVFLIREVEASIDLSIVKNTFELKYSTFIWNITDRELTVEDILRPLLSRDIVSVHFSEFTNENFYSYTDFGKNLRRYIIENDSR